MRPLLLTLFLLSASVITTAQQMAPSLEWSKVFGGTKDDRAYSIIKGVDDGFVLAGYSYSNDGDVTGHHGTTTSSDAWLVKVNDTGGIVWQRSFGGTGFDEFKTVIATADGNYIAFGTTTSNDGDVSGNHGGKDIWVVKVDRYGTLIWQQCFGGTEEENAGNIRQNADGSFYFAGGTYSNNGDVIGGPAPGFGSGAWMVKLASNGTISWQWCIRSFTAQCQDIVETGSTTILVNILLDGEIEQLGGAVFTGQQSSLINLDTSAKSIVWYGQVGAESGSSAAIAKNGNRYVALGGRRQCSPLSYKLSLTMHAFVNNGSNTTKLNTVGLGIPEGCPVSDNYDILGTRLEGLGAISILNNTDNIVAGTFDDTVFMTSLYGPHWDEGGVIDDGFVAGIKSVGNIAWKKNYGGTGSDHFTGSLAISETEYFVAGFTNSNDIDVSGNHGNYDFWLVKLGKVNHIKGFAFLDYNKNGIQDIDEPGISNLLVQSTKGAISTASLTLNNGEFSNTVDTGAYTTSVLTLVPNYTVVPVSQNSSFTSYDNLDNLDGFAFQPISGRRDYSIVVHALDELRPGYEIRYRIRYENKGTDTLTNWPVRFIKDNRFTYNSATVTPGSISGDTLNWTIATLPPRETGEIIVTLTAGVPPDVEMDDELPVSAFIDTTGDLLPADNFTFDNRVAISSFDPNDKKENHEGTLLKSDYDAGRSSLIYTIRFQNTGNDTAFNINIRDTLDAKLDIASFKMIGSSHNYKLEVKDGNKLTWTFAKILLPDSNVNEPASHGYITYRIQPKTGLAVGDNINNSASIYFDYNLPVVTNTVVTSIKLPAPDEPRLNGLDATYCSNVGTKKIKIENLPDAASGITVTAKLDNSTLTIAADSTVTIDITTLTAGNHTFTVTYSNASGNRVKQNDFTVTATVTPEVNVTANITNVTNLTTPVTITATNAAGGGTTPLYTFAKDKNFTTIVQAEGAGTTLAVDPNNLVIGDNKYFVRMKTSATCYTQQTNIDSITIRRDQSTGITDVDNPVKSINVYPNPFRKDIFINGLLAGKSYMITIYNLQGQQLYSKRVSNRSSVSFAYNAATGIYWLSIYDEKKKQLLGSVKLVKE